MKIEGYEKHAIFFSSAFILPFLHYVRKLCALKVFRLPKFYLRSIKATTNNYKLLTIFQSVILNLSEAVKVAHFQKLANQSVSLLSTFFLKFRKLWSLHKAKNVLIEKINIGTVKDNLLQSCKLMKIAWNQTCQRQESFLLARFL